MTTKVILVCLLIGFLLPSPRQAEVVKLKPYVINLDSPPEERWKEVARDKKDLVNEIFALFMKNVGQRDFEMLFILAAEITNEIPEPYLSEIVGFAENINSTIGEVIFHNVLYEITAYGGKGSKACTSVVATLSNGQIIHGRNLDYGVPDLNRITVVLDFQKGGKTVYKGTTFAGYFGLLTAMKPSRYTVSLDERDQGMWTDNDFEAAKIGPKGMIAFAIRDLLEDDSVDFEKAVTNLSTIELTTPSYIILGGLTDNQGAVITRDREKAIDIWRLNSTNNQWFLVETNYDHWNPPPKDDDRRDPANKLMNSVGQQKLDSNSLFGVLSTPPILNQGTKYTTVMSASDPDMYTTWIRLPYAEDIAMR